MKIKDIEGKRIKEIMDADTIVCDDLRAGWDETVIESPLLAGTLDDTTVIYTEYYVFIFDGQKLKAVFHVYEVRDVSFNKERGLVTAVGHETTHEYWLDNGEYKSDYTR